MVEDYYIQSRHGCSYQKGLGPKGKKLMGFKEYYRTKAGEFEPEQWRTKVLEAINQDGEIELLDIIKEHCREHCAWLHKEIEISDYAMDILAGRVFLCGNPAWKDVWDKIRKKYFIFNFAEESL